MPGEDQVVHFPKTGGDDPGSRQPEQIDAMDYVARVLAQVPPPRKHLVRYHGDYSNAARGTRRRDHDTRLARAGADVEHEIAEPTGASLASTAAVALRKRWADRLRRVYEIDPLVCPRCSARMKVTGFITQTTTIKRILDHLHRSPSSRPRPPPAPSPEQTARLA